MHSDDWPTQRPCQENPEIIPLIQQNQAAFTALMQEPVAMPVSLHPRRCHVCPGTGAHPCHVCPGRGSFPAGMLTGGREVGWLGVAMQSGTRRAAGRC